MPEKEVLKLTDASLYGLEAMLCNKIDAKLQLIYCSSAALSTAERNYSQFERKAVATNFALQKFHKFIYERHTEIYTDALTVKTSVPWQTHN